MTLAAALLFLATKVWRPANLSMLPSSDAPSRSAWSTIRFETLPRPARSFGVVFVGPAPADRPTTRKQAPPGIVFLNETLWYALVVHGISLPRACHVKAHIDRLFGVKIALE